MVVRNLVYYRPVVSIEMSKKASTCFVWCFIQVSSSSGGWGLALSFLLHCECGGGMVISILNVKEAFYPMATAPALH